MPKIAGYSIRTHNILIFQKKLISPIALVDPNNIRGKKPYILDGISYYKYPPFLGYNLINNSKILHLLKFSQAYNIIYNYLVENQKKFIKDFVNSKKIDLIHAHSPSKSAKIGCYVAKNKKIPFIYEVRGFIEDTKVGLGKWTEKSLKYRKRRKKETELMKRADAVITLGKAMKKEIQNRGINENKIFIVPNGVDTQKFVPEPIDENLKMKLNLQQVKLIGYVGSIRKIEGLEILLKAFYFLEKKIKNIKIIIVGPVRPETYLISLKSYIRKLKIENNVIFTGKVSYEDIKKYYSIIDVFVLPRLDTRVNRIVTPLKPLEVMALGKLLLASDLPALKELVIPKVTGDLFEPENSKMLANKLEYYLRNLDKIDELKNNAREWVLKNFDWSEVVKRYIPIYEELIKKSQYS
ncbi:MAG: glycosyltransferase family 4 protein [Promethearchaeota archaeon]